ncbi:uncharacterized protein LOC124143446 [Haliotis rufescens]|uniref:uncharacterized protein LOC124143446 n=1 Tax=Haliotis rufescens TaxID=6454 RepID=UPI00201F0FB0|nr:uncharacterized protein LOC124143446 [Haliotis rufescens]
MMYCVLASLLWGLGVAVVQDQTRVPGTSGSEVTEAVVNSITESCLFPDDKLFLRRLAYVETHDGTDAKTYRPGYDGGIWQIDQDKFNMIKNTGTLFSDVSSQFAIDWSTVQWSDLRKPLYSGLAAALYLSTISEPLPQGAENQGSYFRKYFHDDPHSAHNYYTAAKQLNIVCSRTNLDLAFLMDASGSVSADDFDSAKRFARDVIKIFQIGPNDVRVAFISFSTGYRAEFDFIKYTAKDEVLGAIDKVTKAGGGTETDLALNFASEDLFTDAMGSRNGSSKIILLVTDGKSNASTRTIAAARRARKKGIIIFAIGVGRHVDHLELVGVANAPSCTHVIVLSGYSDLTALVSEIQQRSCKAPAVLKTGTYTLPCSKDELYQILTDGPTTQVTVSVENGEVDIYGSSTYQSPNIAVNSFHSTALPGVPCVMLLNADQGALYLNVTTSGHRCAGKYTITVGDLEWVAPYVPVICVKGTTADLCSVTNIYKNIYQFLSPPYSILNPCKPGAPTNKPHPLDQTKFIYCGSNGTDAVFQCPPHHVYDLSTMNCVIGEPSTTTTSTTTTTTTTTPTPTPTPTPTTTTPSTTTTADTTFEPTTFLPGNPCTKEHLAEGIFLFPYPPDKTKYIDCSNFPNVGFIKQCDAGKVWDELDFICSFEHVIINQTELIFDLIPNPCRPHRNNGDVFFYAHPTDRQRYIHCDQYGNGFEQICPGNEFWHEELLQCVPDGLIIG